MFWALSLLIFPWLNLKDFSLFFNSCFLLPRLKILLHSIQIIKSMGQTCLPNLLSSLMSLPPEPFTSSGHVGCSAWGVLSSASFDIDSKASFFKTFSVSCFTLSRDRPLLSTHFLHVISCLTYQMLSLGFLTMSLPVLFSLVSYTLVKS